MTKIKSRKAESLKKILPEVWKTRKFDDLLLHFGNAVYKQNTTENWTKGCSLPFSENGDLGIIKNYRGITLTSIVAKVYNALLLNLIKPESKVLRKNQNSFWKSRTQDHKFCWLIEGVHVNLKATLLVVDFSKALDSIHKGKMEQIWQVYGLPKETITSIMMLCRCPWCNGYRRRKWTRRHEFKSSTRLIAFHIALIYLGKVWIQLFSLQLWVNSRTDWVLQPWWGN